MNLDGEKADGIISGRAVKWLWILPANMAWKTCSRGSLRVTIQIHAAFFLKLAGDPPQQWERFLKAFKTTIRCEPDLAAYLTRSLDMSLKWYLRPRLVMLKPDAPVLEAARALEHNNIGAVVVQDRGSVVGILTDRDLAIRVLGEGLDAHTTTIGEVMTKNVASLAPTDTQASAIRLMQRRNIRRIPIVEDERLVGIVTLDDLFLDEAAPIDRLAAIIEAQIGEGGPADTERSPARRRSAARAEATYRRLVNQVRADTGLEEEGQPETALDIVLDALARRLTPEEAEDLIAQLPSLLQPGLYALPPGPDRLVTRETIEQELARQLGVGRARAADLLSKIGALIAQMVSTGQMEDVRGQLPESLRDVFSDAPSPASS